jgi:trans-aconitate 2-methyltransferase
VFWPDPETGWPRPPGSGNLRAVSGVRYTFGDGDLAARRLALVASVYEGSSRALLASAVPAGAGTVVDLGCGPGYTTRLVAEVCRPRRTIGLDSSATFVELARRLTAEAGERGVELAVEFAVHDATELPFPASPVDAVHARLLLAHLPDPLGVVEGWRSQLRPGGVVVLDEVEAMHVPPGVLRDYEALVVAVVASGGGAMYAGPLIEPLGGRCVQIVVDGAVAARMYGLNLVTWRDDAVDRGLATAAELDRVAAGLHDLAGRPGTTAVRWVMRQVVVEG